MAHDVFISYSSKDKVAADMVVAALESAGVRCWVAPRDILLGHEWAASILHAIEASRLMVLVFSDHANNSTHVRKEVERAVHHGLAVAPIRLTDAFPADALEYFLSSSHWLDAMTPPLQQHLSELTRMVQLLLSGSPAKRTGPPQDAVAAPAARLERSSPASSPNNNRPLLFAAVAAALLVMIAGAWLAASRLGWTGNMKSGASSVSTKNVSPTNNVEPTHAYPNDPTSPGTNTPAIPPAHDTSPATIIDASTAEEFVQAIGPDRTIRLHAAEYMLTDVIDRHMEFVHWIPDFDGKSLTLRNVRNLSIIGTGDKPARLIVRPRYIYVLNFEKCHDIHLANLTLGHAPELGFCSCGVVGATDCSGLAFKNCDLFGCGTEGLTLRNVRNLSFLDSTIRDCSSGIMIANGCTGLSFTRSRFAGNGNSDAFSIDDCKDISFSDCDIENSTCAGSIFNITSSSGVEFEGGTIQNNQASALMEEADTVTFTNATVQGNDFTRH